MWHWARSQPGGAQAVQGRLGGRNITSTVDCWYVVEGRFNRVWVCAARVVCFDKGEADEKMVNGSGGFEGKRL